MEDPAPEAETAVGQAAFLGCFLKQKTKTESKAAAVLTQLPCGAMQIEDPAPALKRLRDRRDLAALAAKPWAVEAARRVRAKACCCPFFISFPPLHVRLHLRHTRFWSGFA